MHQAPKDPSLNKMYDEVAIASKDASISVFPIAVLPLLPPQWATNLELKPIEQADLHVR